MVWIGTSFYFVALDNHLRPVQDARRSPASRGRSTAAASTACRSTGSRRRGSRSPALVQVGGVHDLVERVRAPRRPLLPRRRHVPRRPRRRRSRRGLGGRDQRWLARSRLDPLRRSAGSSGARQLLLAIALLAFVAAAAYGVSNLFSARAVPIQLGAMLGTMMAGNVLFVIIPGQRELVRAKQAGREPDPAHGIRGKQRSVHNNYLTLPVVLAMIAPHFPFLYTHERAWLVLLALMVLGAWIRLFFNLRHQGGPIWTIPATAAVALFAHSPAIRPEDGSSGAGGAPVPFARSPRSSSSAARRAIPLSRRTNPSRRLPGRRPRHARRRSRPRRPRSRSRPSRRRRCRSGT